MASAPQCENVTQTQRNNEMGDTNISKSSDHNDESDLRQCWVCGEKSSTYHYGVVSCDGCKSFFSRSQSLHTAYKCGNQTCTVNRLTRNQCQYCRWIKCLAVGMSKEACKLGRRSKKLKADMKKKSLLLKEVEQNSEQANNIVPEELATSKRIRLNETDVNATSASNNVTQQVSENEKPGKLKIDTSMGKTNHVDNHHVQCDQDKHTSSTENNIDKCDVAMEWFDIKPSVNESILANRIPTTASPYDQKVQQLERLTVKELVRRMHQTQYNTFQSRHIEGKNKALAGQHHTPASLERLWGAITSSFTHLIEGVVTFAKRLPGFRQLDLDDRMVITKLGCFEVVTVRLSMLHNLYTNEMEVFAENYSMSIEHAKMTPMGDFVIAIFDFCVRINSLCLTDSEKSLLSAVILMSADRPGLNEKQLVASLQDSYLRALQYELRRNHPEDDSLLSQVLLLLPKLREINCEHSKRLMEMKVSPDVQFPPLHQEVFSK